MDKDKEQYHQVYEEHSKNASSKDAVLTEINKSDRPMDFDGSKLGLETHMYGMDGLSPIRMMVKKGNALFRISSETYGLLRGFRHPNLLPIENYSTRGHGWFIVPCVSGSLKGWMNSQNGSSMFQGVGQNKDITPQFRAMLIDLCSLFNKLSQKSLFPRTFGIWDCYIKVVSGVPKIQVLLTDAQKRHFKPGAMAEKMQEFITECCRILRIDLTDNSKNFISYICDPAKARHVDQDLSVPLHTFLERYPDSWTFIDKESYVFARESIIVE